MNVVSLSADLITRPSDLNDFLRDDSLRRLEWLNRSVLLYFRCTTREILLMLLTLRVCEITALVRVQRETQLTFVRAEVILHKIRICARRQDE
jgi:hypothetical protein